MSQIVSFIADSLIDDKLVMNIIYIKLNLVLIIEFVS